MVRGNGERYRERGKGVDDAATGKLPWMRMRPICSWGSLGRWEGGMSIWAKEDRSE